MNLDSINRRLDKLDALHSIETPRRFIHLIVEADKGETKDQAIARWCLEHPNEADDGSLVLPWDLPGAKPRPQADIWET